MMVNPERGTKGSRVNGDVAVHWGSEVEVIMTRRGAGVIKGGTDHSTVRAVAAREDVTVASSVREAAG
jgi:hypothetical protein